MLGSAALRMFDLVFGKYLVYCYKSFGLDLTKEHFVNYITYTYVPFLFLALFSVIYTALTANLETKLIALVVLGPTLQVINEGIRVGRVIFRFYVFFVYFRESSSIWQYLPITVKYEIPSNFFAQFSSPIAMRVRRVILFYWSTRTFSESFSWFT